MTDKGIRVGSSLQSAPAFFSPAAFLKDTRANIAMTFALSILPILMLVGVVVDYTRAVGAETILQHAASAGALAGANMLDVNGDPEEVARDYAMAILGTSPGLAENATINVTADVALNSKFVKVTVTANLPTIFMGMAGKETMRLSREAEAADVKMNVEIAMVLDVSSSMRNAKIDNLRVAAKEFVQAVLEGDNAETTTISVIPFGGTVHLGNNAFFPYVLDQPTFEYGAPFNYSVDLPDTQAEWNGCLEMTPEQVKLVTLDENSHGVVHYYTVNANNENPWCPNDQAARANFLSNNVEGLVDLFEGYNKQMLSDGTGTDIGMSWGVRSLDPVWQGKLRADGSIWSARPAPYDDETTRKVLIVMSDGGITGQLRPRDPITTLMDGVDPDFTAPKSPTSQFYNGPTALDNFNYLCDYAKDNGVLVFSIAFNINNAAHNSQMRACATSNAHFFDVQTLDIAQAFRVITERISSLRLTR